MLTISQCIIIIAISEIVLISIHLLSHMRYKKRIKEIYEYINAVNNGHYSLKIEDNGKDELSRLRNELYKITVLLRETAEKSEKEKEQLSDFLADISHQIKTPLTSIRILLDNLSDNPNMDANTRNDFITEISKQAELISLLTISLLKIARFDAGVINMENADIDAKIFITNIISNLSALIEQKRVEIVLAVDEGAKFYADSRWQAEAITNIIKNAIEHSYENSKVYITVKNTSLFLKIIIKDEGKGIPKKELRHIFERFYKSKNSSRENIGIGLALAKTIIEKNNGYVKAYSEEGKGTSFEIKYVK